MKSLARVRRRQGRAYELAAKAMTEEEGAETWLLVHGTVWNGYLGLRMGHAWIELGGHGHVYDPVFNKYFDSREYVARYAAVPLLKYTKKEVVERILAPRSTYGPWA